ncbi:OmpA family protein [Pseudomonas sp. zfem002]|uniref:OmpA family protein n=1 Tax=Pseudomonas sp. zfem002 TaxID=3078197 RepID=UPI0029279568|nr:OmpA family protein [Pseudomonas sp. zfem002]MDU9394880.1 OmpA family protein [Pseudomonas sp. zfem002]
MTAVFDMRVQVGGDPRHCEEFQALCAELAKLHHPACPDLDWDKVEQLCAALFRRNGADLQSTVALVLARARCHGLDGLIQGLVLLEALLGQWPRLWPNSDATRLEILDWLCVQLQGWLRGVTLMPSTLAVVLQLQTRLESLRLLLAPQVSAPLASLGLLQQYVAGLLLRLEGAGLPSVAVERGGAERVVPLLIVTPPPLPPPAPPPVPELFVPAPPRRRGRALGWVLGLVVLLGLSVWAGWSHWRDDQALVRQLPTEIDLGSLGLFAPGSVELAPEATRPLVEALVRIKAQPGWQIVITGHTDTSGEEAYNQRLSRERAMAVRDWLQRMGDIPQACFVVQSAAASQPLASNDSAAGRAANRRVEIRLVAQGQGCGVGGDRQGA